MADPRLAFAGCLQSDDAVANDARTLNEEVADIKKAADRVTSLYALLVHHEGILTPGRAFGRIATDY
jgi:hypothetical protein